VGGELLELPAGTVDQGETVEATARRELLEETGYSARSLEKLGWFYTVPGSADEIIHVFLARGLTRGEQKLENYERITVEVYTEQRVRQMVANGDLHDAKTLAGLNVYWLRKAARNNGA
jgi:ADP-ribose pyrophosphatase